MQPQQTPTKLYLQSISDPQAALTEEREVIHRHRLSAELLASLSEQVRRCRTYHPQLSTLGLKSMDYLAVLVGATVILSRAWVVAGPITDRFIFPHPDL